MYWVELLSNGIVIEGAYTDENSYLFRVKSGWYNVRVRNGCSYDGETWSWSSYSEIEF